ncbi:MAG: hypothetical protein CVV51_04875 [Spirochaetae bacterium HGW-Spirochaetae-7]|nr:MAG: hypothetical protein CVV51_04875 [Spirochaetae bacterium HGW-Spirochaetae-7]
MKEKKQEQINFRVTTTTKFYLEELARYTGASSVGQYLNESIIAQYYTMVRGIARKQAYIEAAFEIGVPRETAKVLENSDALKDIMDEVKYNKLIQREAELYEEYLEDPMIDSVAEMVDLSKIKFDKNDQPLS